MQQWYPHQELGGRGAGLAEGNDNVVSCSEMWLWSVLWWASCLRLASGTLDLKFLSEQRQMAPLSTTQMDCFEYPKFGTHRFGSVYNEDWHSRKPAIKDLSGFFAAPYPITAINTDQMARRIDRLFPKEHDLIKEHAKLVQDINSLKQVVYVAPFDDSRDLEYDDSIYHQIIETSSTTTTRQPPSTLKPAKSTRPHKYSSFPVILLGGESTHHVVRSQPIAFPKSTISLVGTTVTPLLKHPYPFVMHSAPEKSLRFCMTPLPSYSTTTRRPGFLERLINSFLPNRSKAS